MPTATARGRLHAAGAVDVSESRRAATWGVHRAGLRKMLLVRTWHLHPFDHGLHDALQLPTIDLLPIGRTAIGAVRAEAQGSSGNAWIERRDLSFIAQDRSASEHFRLTGQGRVVFGIDERSAPGNRQGDRRCEHECDCADDEGGEVPVEFRNAVGKC